MLIIVENREIHHILICRTHLTSHRINVGKGVIGFHGNSDLILCGTARVMIFIRIVVTGLIARIGRLKVAMPDDLLSLLLTEHLLGRSEQGVQGELAELLLL